MINIIRKEGLEYKNGINIFIINKEKYKITSYKKYGIIIRYGEKLSDSELKNKIIGFIYKDLWNKIKFFKRFSFIKMKKDEYQENEICKFQNSLNLYDKYGMPMTTEDKFNIDDVEKIDSF